MKHHDQVPNCFYRISAKALILNKTRDKYLIVREDNGKWELPGGGLEWGASVHEDIAREIQEEMGLQVLSVSNHPAYFLTTPHDRTGTWVAQVLYETSVSHLDFIPSRECQEIRFVGPGELPERYYSNIPIIADMFDPSLHQ